MNRSLIQFIIHLSFWAFIFLFMLDAFMVDSPIEEAISGTFLECLFWGGIAYLNLYLIIPLSLNKAKDIRWGKYVLLLVLMLTISNLLYTYTGAEAYIWGETGLRVKLTYSVTAVLFALISFLYWYVGNYHRAREENMLMERERLQMEVMMLKSQVSPHFLFNSFNNIYSLTVAKSDDAPKFVNCLAEILRYLIYEGNKDRVPLSKELNLIERYIELEELKKTKGIERIKYTCKGSPDQLTIVPLLIINFVENAFKHGDLKEEGFIHFEARIDGNHFELKNTNTTSKLKLGSGIGMTNLRNQLEIHYPYRHTLDVNLEDNIFSLHLKIEL